MQLKKQQTVLYWIEFLLNWGRILYQAYDQNIDEDSCKSFTDDM